MNDIEDNTYIYVLGQFDDNGKLMFNKSFKIGKADNLKQRFNQEYKNNTGYFDPRYIRVIEVSKSIHNVPDKPLHALLLFCEPLIIRESKYRELFAFDGPEALEYFDNKLYDLPAIIKYYTDPQEIEELVERESIIKDYLNNLVNDVISENVDVTPNNIDLLKNTSDTKLENIKTIIARSCVYLNYLYKKNNNNKYKTSSKQFKLYINHCKELLVLNDEEINNLLTLNKLLCYEKVHQYLDKITDKITNNSYTSAIITKLKLYHKHICDDNLILSKSIFDLKKIQKWINEDLTLCEDTKSLNTLHQTYIAWCDNEGYNPKKVVRKDIKKALEDLQQKSQYGLIYGNKHSDNAQNGTNKYPQFNFCSKDELDD